MLLSAGTMQNIQTDPVLERLQASFDAQRASLVTKHSGQWALLIEGDPQPQFFGSDIEAAAAGFSHRPPARFLINEILAEEQPIHIPHMAIAD
ncbi:hypothetical protein [Candidatus Poriferisocius sp.]|uniref:hypothetical protein n=1 Tax=Candidatus Poriferisocius sp. TaxID=3101276 RepID=UPI003B028E79